MSTQPSTPPSSPPPNSPPVLDPCLRPLISELVAANVQNVAAEVGELWKKQWGFELVASASVALVLLSILGRALRDPELEPEERSLIHYLAAFFHGVFGESLLIQDLIRRAFPEVFAAPRNGAKGAANAAHRI